MTGQILALPSQLDTAAATPLARQLLALRGEAVTLDASGVERLGAQCLQVILAAARTWASDGQALVLTQASQGMSEGLRLMGATNKLRVEGAP